MGSSYAAWWLFFLDCALSSPIGVYSWDSSYWRTDNPALIDFIKSDLGYVFASGSLYINVADYSSADVIPDQDRLVRFAKEFRRISVNPDAVLYFTYGDVTAKDGNAMVEFTKTFFGWVCGIDPVEAGAMGRIGLSYDVEHVHPDFTKRALLLAQELRASSPFGPDNIIIQYTIEGDRNVLGTDYAFRYADSVLVMLYSNFLRPGQFPQERSLSSRIKWVLTSQCEKCLDEGYTISNYRAKISIMVEASCKMGKSCGWASFCAYDGAEEGAAYLAETLSRAFEQFRESGLVSETQYERLFNLQDLFVVHNFEWYKCFPPFNHFSNYDSCKPYHALAEACRVNV
jgi:hypothetical protein